MNRRTYQTALNELKKSVIEMADQVLKNVRQGLQSFEKNDLDLAREIIKADDQIDMYEEEISKQALRIIWKEQPIAQDLRLVTTILKILTDIERIGDHASDISEIALHLEGHQFSRDLTLVLSMAKHAEHMVQNAIEALVSEDAVLAKLIIAQDDMVDDLYKQMIERSAEWIKDDVDDTPYVISIILISKYLERVADHAVNIAEWVIFLVTGSHKNTPLY
ncbi:phosphate signaling complex protein PhoU [Acholeplasma vituli]|uniref:Phosphate-specific transport system accessory protein PhoU n=1 Tax=Paracholeplasma vituli TaxID=69473 RepID=A0ABT2PUX4_9MOLU|nr:phosphate signaling complex protein PhoU [Paracholeplasma vituli]MCU0104751.1 phosphate signaling complex protein PhoU [Paracholeplasma vituli]